MRERLELQYPNLDETLLWVDDLESTYDVEMISRRNPFAGHPSTFDTIAGVRYFCTGDVGQASSRGCLQTVDRKKALFKGDPGEHVSLSKVAALLKVLPSAETPIVHGWTGAKHVIGGVLPAGSSCSW